MDIVSILQHKFSGSEWVLSGDTYDGLEWVSDSPKPSKAELENLWPTVQTEIAAQEQAREDARLSAIAKLQELGLTVDEVQAAFGLKA